MPTRSTGDMNLDRLNLIKAKATAKDTAWLAGELIGRLNQLQESKRSLIANHIHHAYGYTSATAFYLGATPEQKIEGLTECLAAIVTNDFSQLKGKPVTPAEAMATTINGEPVSLSAAFEKFTELAMQPNVSVNINYQITITTK